MSGAYAFGTPVITRLTTPQVPSPTPGEVAINQALQDINNAQSWRFKEDRDRMIRHVLENLATTTWDIGYDDGMAAENRRFREWLDRR